MDEDPYQPPSAVLGNESELDFGSVEGSLETALIGDYDVSVGDVLKESWRLTKGNKGAIWLALVVAGVIVFAVTRAVGILGLPDGQAAIASGDFLLGYAQSMLSGFLLIPLTAPLFAGVYMLCIRRIGGESTRLSEIFNYFRFLPTLVLISIMITVLTYAGLFLLILPGIYLTVAYAFAVPLMLDKGLSPWESLEASRKAVTHRWFSVFGTAIVVYLLGILLTITLVGMIWGRRAEACWATSVHSIVDPGHEPDGVGSGQRDNHGGLDEMKIHRLHRELA